MVNVVSMLLAKYQNVNIVIVSIWHNALLCLSVQPHRAPGMAVDSLVYIIVPSYALMVIHFFHILSCCCIQVFLNLFILQLLLFDLKQPTSEKHKHQEQLGVL